MTEVYDKPQLYVFHEKHGEDYWLVNDLSEKLAMAVTKVRERAERDWYPEPDEPQYLTQYKDITEEVLTNLPEQFKSKVEKERRVNDRLKREYEEELWEWSIIQEIVNAATMEEASILTVKAYGRKHYAALYILEVHRDYEYEGYDVENYRTVKEY